MTSKLKENTIKYVDYLEMVEIVESKYGINVRDFAGKYKWQHEKTQEIMTKYGQDWNVWGKISPLNMNHLEKECHNEYVVQLSEENPENPPYQDFWHFMLDYWFDFAKGKPLYLCWPEIKEYADEEWQKECAQLFINEFGEKEYTVIVDW
jgi:hypothetical protein